MKLFYYLILLPLSVIPSWLRYGLSDLLSFILYRVVGYRRKMVRNNMRLCFPEQDEDWIRSKVKAFYTNLSDIILESIHAFSIRESAAIQRIYVKNPEVLNSLYDQGKSFILTGGHNANWEAITLVGGRMKHRFVALYKPLKNQFMDEKVKGSRERYGTEMVSIKNFRPHFIDLESDPKMFIFGIDQSPRKGRGMWMDFLGRDTLVFTGPERLSKEYDIPVVMGRIIREKRGRYSVEFEVLTMDPRSTAEGEITIRSNRDVEALIRKYPEQWLWSHKRWKHTRDGE